MVKAPKEPEIKVEDEFNAEELTEAIKSEIVVLIESM